MKITRIFQLCIVLVLLSGCDKETALHSGLLKIIVPLYLGTVTK